MPNKKSRFENIPVEFRHPLRPPKVKPPAETKKEDYALEEGRGGNVVTRRYHHNPPRNRY
jgi:hypothetical protein